MFVMRVIETSRPSFFARYGSILCALVIATVTFIAPKKTFALTAHNATTVTCYAYNGRDPGDGTSVANPSSINPAIIDAINPSWVINPVAEQCVWSGFGGSGSAVAGDTLTFTAHVTSSSDCAGDAIHKATIGFTSFGGGWMAKSYGPGTPPSLSIPVGADLSQLKVYGTVQAGPNDSCAVNLTLTSLYATF